MRLYIVKATIEFEYAVRAHDKDAAEVEGHALAVLNNIAIDPYCRARLAREVGYRKPDDSDSDDLVYGDDITWEEAVALDKEVAE